MSSFGVFRSPSAAASQRSSEPASQSVPDYSHIFHRLEGSVWNHFSSQATLENVSYLETCSVHGRCTGMILTYLDGHQSVLGQWLEDVPSKPATIRTLESFDRQGLRFFLSYDDGCSYLERVELRSRGCGSRFVDTSGQMVVDVDYAVGFFFEACDFHLLNGIGHNYLAILLFIGYHLF